MLIVVCFSFFFPSQLFFTRGFCHIYVHLACAKRNLKDHILIGCSFVITIVSSHCFGSPRRKFPMNREEVTLLKLLPKVTSVLT